MPHQPMQARNIAPAESGDRERSASRVAPPEQSVEHLDKGFGPVTSQIVNGTFDPTSTSGVRTLTGDLDRPTGSPSIDQGPYCEVHANRDCFLKQSQRAALIDEYHSRVTDASANYMTALGDLKLERLLERGESDLPWVFALLLDVIGFAAAAAIERSIAAIVKKGPDGLKGLLGVADASVAVENVKKSSWVPLAKLSKAIADGGKKSASSAMLNAYNREGHDRRMDEVAFIDALKDASRPMFAALRLEPPGLVTDAQLLMLYESFESERHLPSVYKEALAAKLTRFSENEIASIGRTADARPLVDSPPLLTSGQVYWMEDRSVVRVTFKSGSAPVYGLVRKRWIRPHDPNHVDRIPPLDPDRFAGEPIIGLFRIDSIPEFVGFVRAEFVDVALERHKQMWGCPPETIQVDDSDFFWDRDRANRARAHRMEERPVLDRAFDSVRVGGAS
jgi:hypothetical protein